jgi:hypothetical protein
MTQSERETESRRAGSQSRREFLIVVAKTAAISSTATFAWTAPASHTIETLERKLSGSLTNDERILHLRAILEKAIRSGDRAQMLIEAYALDLPDSNMLSLQSVTIDDLRALSNVRDHIEKSPLQPNEEVQIIQPDESIIRRS